MADRTPTPEPVPFELELTAASDPAGSAAVAGTKVFWSRLGGKLGVGLCGLGLLLVFLGWNGAASLDRVPSQFPYLISGGIGGLCLVLIGVGLIVVQNQRADRAALQETIRQLQDSIERLSGAAEATPTNGGFAPVRSRETPTWVRAELADAEPEPAPAPKRPARKRPVRAAD